MKHTTDKHLQLLSLCRVSSRQQSEGYSLEAQARANREWAQRKGHRIADTIQYVETASKRKERRRFPEVIDRIRRDRSLDGVIFHKVDRACRNLADLALLEQLEADDGKRVFFSSQEFPQNAAGRLGVGVMGLAARWYTDNLREEVNKGLRSKVKAGEYRHRPPHGYRMSQDSYGRKLPVPDPERADAVRAAFKLMASGQYTLDALRDELFRRGLFFRPSTPKWTRSHLHRMLRHPFYVRRIVWRGQLHQGKHEPLLDESTWRKVQDALSGRRRGRRRLSLEFTYGQGLIRCAECGYQITAELHKGRYTYYRCSQVQYREHARQPAWVPESEVETQIVATLDELVLPEEVLGWATEYLRRAGKDDLASAEEQLKSLRRQAAGIQAALDGLLLQAAQDDSGLRKESTRLAKAKQNELELLRARMKELGAGKRRDGNRAVKILELAQGLSSHFVTLPGPQKRRIVDSVLLNLRLQGASIVADYRLPFSILVENGRHPPNSPLPL